MRRPRSGRSYPERSAGQAAAGRAVNPVRRCVSARLAPTPPARLERVFSYLAGGEGSMRRPRSGRSYPERSAGQAAAGRAVHPVRRCVFARHAPKPPARLERVFLYLAGERDRCTAAGSKNTFNFLTHFSQLLRIYHQEPCKPGANYVLAMACVTDFSVDLGAGTSVARKYVLIYTRVRCCA
jgi:hypothetical protein